MRAVLLAAALVLLAAGCGGGGAPPEESSFGDDLLIVSTDGWRTDFARHTVPLIQFASGGPGKDGIPALDRPRFESVEAAGRWLQPRVPVIELELGSEARAYPLAILVWHEIVNDVFAGTPVAVTFCPLCNTALAFDRRLDGRLLDFGTTGNLRHSDLVMYDRQTESWWQQFDGRALVGELAGSRLGLLPARIVAWADFVARHPGGEVLSRETGYERPYGANPYPGYEDVDSPTLVGTPNQSDGRVALKERVAFVELDGDAVAVPFPELERAGTLRVELAGERIELVWLPGISSPLGSFESPGGRTVGSAFVRSVTTGEPVASTTPFWFAVAAFRPDVRVLDAAGREIPGTRRAVEPARPEDIQRATARLAG